MHLNNLGQIVQDEWFRTSIVRPDVELDALVVMPNHVHGIVILTSVGAGFVVSSAERPRCLPCEWATTGGCPYGGFEPAHNCPNAL